MRNKLKFIILPCLLFVVILLATACGKEQTPFKRYDKAGYTVSVQYDANGGVFTTNTATIIDTYNLDGYTANAQGNKDLKLFAPNASERGNQAYTATRNGYYLAGWYAKRTEVKDAAGNVTGYTYDEYWDFDNDRLSVDATKEYKSKEIVKTLYAAWIPDFTYDFEFYVFGEDGTPQLVSTTQLSPIAVNKTITLPSDSEKTGMVNAPNSFPVIAGKTYDKIYLDENKTVEVTAETLTHIGKFNRETVAVEDRVMKLYCTTTDGVTYNITSPEQLAAATNPSATYNIQNDLDFSGKAWPALFTTNEFSGEIIGNGHTIKNVTIIQNNTANTAFGLFGKIADTASVSNLTFDGVTARIRGFSNVANAAFGILAGEIEDGAGVSGIVLQNSKLEIVKGTNLIVAVNSKNPLFGLVCAVGEITGVTYSSDNVSVLFSGTLAQEFLYTPDANGQFTLSPAQG